MSLAAKFGFLEAKDSDNKRSPRTERRRNRRHQVRTTSDGTGKSEEIKCKTYYGDHKTGILAILDSDRDDEDSYCDVVLQVNGDQFPAHKCILGKLSPFFHKMFKSEMKEKYDSVASIHGVTDDIMDIILEFIYKATIIIDEEIVMEVLVAADYLQFESIKKFCVEFLSESMNKENCLSLQVRGDMFNCPTLTDTAETMAVQNFEEVITQLQFKELDKKSALSFLKSRDQKAFGSRAVYEGALTWVEHDLESRREDFVDFFKVIKLHLLPASYLQDVVANQQLMKESHDCKDYFQNELLYRLKLPSSVHQSSDDNLSFSSSAPSDLPKPKESSTKVEPVCPAPTDDTSSTSSNAFVQQAPYPSRMPPSIFDRSYPNYADDNSSTHSSQTPSEDSIPMRYFATASSHSSAPNQVVFSKELVKILRHGKYRDIVIDAEGYASAQHILINPRFKRVCGKRNIDDVKQLVADDDKNRFEMKLVGSVWKIRATRGHTIQVQVESEEENIDDEYGYSEGRYTPSRSRTSSESFSSASFPGNPAISKELVRILRHGKYKDIHVDFAGYARVYDILDNRKFQNVCGELDVDDLKDVVENSRKKYFEMRDVGSELKIKALHGHSVPVDNLNLTRLDLRQLNYQFVYHQTTKEAWEKIQTGGLSRMKRTHIHFKSVMPRYKEKPGAAIVIEVELRSAIQGGLTFFASSDNVVLCEGDHNGRIHPKFFKRVINLSPYYELDFNVPPDFSTASTSQSKQSPGKKYWQRRKR